MRPRCRLSSGRRAAGGEGQFEEAWRRVLPPALMAAMPVGASTTCFSLYSRRCTSGRSICPYLLLPVGAGLAGYTG